MNNFENWMKEQFTDEELADMCNYGVSSGFSGLTYTADILNLYKTYKDALSEIIFDNEDESFSIIIKSMENKISSLDDLEEKVVWYCADLIAYKITKGEYLSDEDMSASSIRRI